MSPPESPLVPDRSGRVYDEHGRPLCFVCGERQSEHPGGIECAAPGPVHFYSPSDLTFIVKALEVAAPLEEVAYNRARMRWMARETREEMERMDRADQRLHEAARELADVAASAVYEPRRFHENEDERQQQLGQAVARVRLLLTSAASDEDGHDAR